MTSGERKMQSVIRSIIQEGVKEDERKVKGKGKSKRERDRLRVSVNGAEDSRFAEIKEGKERGCARWKKHQHAGVVIRQERLSQGDD